MKKIIAGVDEVGRGSLVGPVFAAAVIFKKKIDKSKIKDSKQLSKEKRNGLEKYIKRNSIWSIGSASKKEIEKLNILNATLLAMKRSIKKLKLKPSITEISAASIIAKVARDKLITKMSKNFKKYAWDKNAGYGTKQHLKAIKKFGITKHHRKTFGPIHNMLSPS